MAIFFYSTKILPQTNRFVHVLHVGVGNLLGFARALIQHLMYIPNVGLKLSHLKLDGLYTVNDSVGHAIFEVLGARNAFKITNGVLNLNIAHSAVNTDEIGYAWTGCDVVRDTLDGICLGAAYFGPYGLWGIGKIDAGHVGHV